jgi:3-hydroxyisobutyrate dehydrogenase
MRVAVLGTGIMGAGMARSLARDGHEVTVWNRTRARADALAGDRIGVAGSVAAAVGGADAVLTVVFDEESVLALTDELVGALGPHAVWVQASTVGPHGMRRIAAAAGGAADRLVDGPVLGTRKPAEDGTLVVLASGPAAARAVAAPVLDAIGSRTVVVGDELGDASALKLVCNAFVATLNTGIAQSYAFASALGLDPTLFLEALRGGAMDAPYVGAKAAVIGGRGWDEPSFAVDGVRKDVGLMREAAREAGLPEDLLAVLADLYDRAAADGLGGADMAAVATVFGEGR